MSLIMLIYFWLFLKKIFFLHISELSWHFDVFVVCVCVCLCFTGMLSFFNHPISYIFAPNFRHIWPKTTIYFILSFFVSHSSVECLIESFTIISIVSSDSSFIGAVSFQLGMFNYLLKFARTFNFRLVCMFTLVLQDCSVIFFSQHWIWIQISFKDWTLVMSCL